MRLVLRNGNVRIYIILRAGCLDRQYSWWQVHTGLEQFRLLSLGSSPLQPVTGLALNTLLKGRLSLWMITEACRRQCRAPTPPTSASA